MRVAAGLCVALSALTGCGLGPTSTGPTQRDGDPALVLTPAQETAVAALARPTLSPRGDPLALLRSVEDLIGTSLACEDVTDHLGIEMPTFPTLEERGFTASCGSAEGSTLFEHPVPSAATPPPPAADPAADVHGIKIAYVPPGVTLDRTPFDEARAEGLVWMTILYGGSIAQPSSAPTTAEPPRADVTRLTWRNGDPLGVQYSTRGETRLAWRGTVADHVFDVSVDAPGDPVAGVALLRDGVDLPS
ncbi:hypothetical protein [Kineococcus rubinsiae]|uniref:hypothetical protein n=1 Tax=Kineococcus rubinsiae TaxID=2609562 RepID=UPI0027E5460A|nr:hypothetical protein [Kineococcus rubinsiae]